jgi:hypothetical protein
MKPWMMPFSSLYASGLRRRLQPLPAKADLHRPRGRDLVGPRRQREVVLARRDARARDPRQAGRRGVHRGSAILLSSSTR